LNTEQLLHPLARGMINVSTCVTVTLSVAEGSSEANSTASPRYFATLSMTIKINK